MLLSYTFYFLFLARPLASLTAKTQRVEKFVNCSEFPLETLINEMNLSLEQVNQNNIYNSLCYDIYMFMVGQGKSIRTFEPAKPAICYVCICRCKERLGSSRLKRQKFTLEKDEVPTEALDTDSYLCLER